MQYKTIVLELIQQEYPLLHQQLCDSRTLLSTLNLQAAALKRYHEDRMDSLAQAKPGREESQIASEALELALEDLRDSLPSESVPDETEEPLSLDAAMEFLRRHTPPA